MNCPAHFPAAIRTVLFLIFGVTSHLHGDDLSSGKSPRKPNVILILADDLGYGDLGCHGNAIVRTPRIDRLAGQSARLDRFHSTPVCATTRASLLTGRPFLDTGVWGVHLARDYMRLDETTLGNVFQQAGYATGFMGKWHNGKHEPWLPWNRGFQQCWMASLYVHENNIASHNGRAEPWAGWTSDRLADKAVEYMENNKDKPFFLYLAFLAPHEPWRAPGPMVSRYRESGMSEALATVFAMIEQMDTATGRVLDAVDRLGLGDDTIVLFASDNGPINESSNLGQISSEEMALRNPDGMRGLKGNLWDNAIRAPCFIRWPGHIKPMRSDAIAQVTDLFPTLLDLTGTKFSPDPEHPLSGVSLAPVLTGMLADLPPREIVMPYWEARWPEYDSGVLPQPDTLTFNMQNVAVRTPGMKWLQVNGHRELHDMKSDPVERIDISSLHPEMASRCLALARDWFIRTQQRGTGFRQPRFPIGMVAKRIDEVAETRNIGHVPGFSAVATTGNVIVNTHWSIGWNAPGDSQSMDVTVRDPGRYRVEIETLNPTSGAEIGIQVNDRKMTGKLSSAAIADLGEMDLQAGDARMIVRVNSLPEGKSICMERLIGIRFTAVKAD